jgi:hypothetical protein
MKRVATTVRVNARGIGTIYEFVEAVAPGDTLTVDVDVPFVIEINDRPVVLLHKGKSYRLVEQ